MNRGTPSDIPYGDGRGLSPSEQMAELVRRQQQLMASRQREMEEKSSFEATNLLMLGDGTAPSQVDQRIWSSQAFPSSLQHLQNPSLIAPPPYSNNNTDIDWLAASLESGRSIVEQQQQTHPTLESLLSTRTPTDGGSFGIPRSLLPTARLDDAGRLGRPTTTLNATSSLSEAVRLNRLRALEDLQLKEALLSAQSIAARDQHQYQQQPSLLMGAHDNLDTALLSGRYLRSPVTARSAIEMQTKRRQQLQGQNDYNLAGPRSHSFPLPRLPSSMKKKSVAAKAKIELGSFKRLWGSLRQSRLKQEIFRRRMCEKGIYGQRGGAALGNSILFM